METGAQTVTITVQLGAGGFAIARQVAERLAFRYYDWEVTSQAAADAGVAPETVASAERVPSLGERIMERFFNAGFYAGDIPEAVVPASATMDAAIQTLTSDNYRAFISQVVLDLARRGSSVIIGHAAQITLRDEPRVLRALIHGSPERRAERVAEEEGVTAAQAAEMVQRSDRDRSAFFKHYYKVNLLDAGLYDLTLNTDALTDDQASAILIQAAQSLATATA